MTITGTVEALTDGRFVYDGGIWEGVVGEMGPTAVLRSGGLQIVIATHPTYEWTGEQYGSVGVDVTAPKFAVVKNPMYLHGLSRPSSPTTPASVRRSRRADAAPLLPPRRRHSRPAPHGVLLSRAPGSQKDVRTEPTTLWASSMIGTARITS